MKSLSCNNFSVNIMGKNILSDISFNILKGDYLSIIGPNGSGKSTLLKCILSLINGAKYNGEIFIDDKFILKMSQKEIAKNIAYVPQAGGIIPPYSVKDFLILSRYVHRFSDNKNLQNKNAIDKALDLTGMQEFSDISLDKLSGGERQKAYLAAALAQEAEILLLDEPSSFLDPKYVTELDNLLFSLNRENKLTIITVTHDLNHVLASNGLVLALRHGKQCWFGQVKNIKEKQVFDLVFEHRFSFLKHPSVDKELVFV